MINDNKINKQEKIIILASISNHNNPESKSTLEDECPCNKNSPHKKRDCNYFY